MLFYVGDAAIGIRRRVFWIDANCCCEISNGAIVIAFPLPKDPAVIVSAYPVGATKAAGLQCARACRDRYVAAPVRAGRQVIGRRSPIKCKKQDQDRDDPRHRALLSRGHATLSRWLWLVQV